MLQKDLQCRGSATTRAIIDLVAAPLGKAERRPVTGGLPAGALEFGGARLIVAGTPCTVPLFGDAIQRTARRSGCDVMVARHGTYPELLDPVMWDAAVFSGNHPIPLQDLLLFIDQAEQMWLVPSKIGPFLRVGDNGLNLEMEAPFISWSERCRGVCEAAKRIVGATRPSLVD